MNETKKACVVFVAGLEDKASIIAAKLDGDGFEVCLHQASEEEARAARGGARNIDAELTECLKGADLCVFLIDQENQYDGLGSVAYEGGAKVIGVLVGLGAIASGLIDDVGEAVVPIDSKNLDKALQEGGVWEGLDGKPIKPRKVPRQKCP